MRVALISDIHGNEVALRSVLKELRGHRVDRIVCLGDAVTLGPAPHEVIETLAELACPCIRGNHEDFLFDEDSIRKYTDAPPIIEAIRACRTGLTRDELEFLATFEEKLELDMDGVPASLFHGSPRSNTEDLLATTPVEQLDAALGSQRPDLMAGGHTHIQMVRQHNGTLLINPGSVGLPFLAPAVKGPPAILPYADYAIAEARSGALSITLQRLPLDRRTLLRTLDNWDNPLRDYLRQQYGA